MRNLICPEGTEISGDGILSLTQNLNAEEIEPLLEKHHLTDLDRETWYPAQRYLNVLTDIRESFYMTMVAIGMAVGENTFMPPNLGDAPLDAVLMGWNDHYQFHHRNGDIGYATTEKIGEGHYKITINKGLYPDDLEYGVAYGFAKRLLPKGTHFVVEYDSDITRMDDGGDQTVIHVRWDSALS